MFTGEFQQNLAKSIGNLRLGVKSGEQLRRVERDGVVDLNISLTSKVEFYCHRKLFIEGRM